MCAFNKKVSSICPPKMLFIFKVQRKKVHSVCWNQTALTRCVLGGLRLGLFVLHVSQLQAAPRPCQRWGIVSKRARFWYKRFGVSPPGSIPGWNLKSLLSYLPHTIQQTQRSSSKILRDMVSEEVTEVQR